jgi:Cu/Zn superoxide dismutase
MKLGPIPQNGMMTYLDTTGDLKLFGRYGIIGRSIKIHGTEDVCAKIISSVEMTNTRKVTMLQASFTYPVGGTIYMRQVEGEDAIIFGKIYWVDSSMATMNHNWHVHINQPSTYYRAGNCTGVSGHFNPFDVNITTNEYMMNCGPDNLQACEVGDLSGKHGRMTISDKPAPYNQYSFLFHDDFLNLTGVNAVINRSIAIHAITTGTPVMACAPLVQVETLTLSTHNQRFSASQSSRFGPTSVKTNYNSSNLTIFDSVISPNQLCQVTFSNRDARAYNPHDAPNLDGTDNTPDHYPVGDFGKKRYNFSQSVSELPIQGSETIAGHTLGYTTREGDKTQYTCSSLWPSYPPGSNVKMAKATFNNVVSGAIYFIQRNIGNGVYGKTYIFVDIWYNNRSRSATTGHKWHIHERPPVRDQLCVDSIGGHFNPFNVSIDPSQNYTTECSSNSPLRCESGDLSGKHPRLTIGASIADRRTYSYVDDNLHLWGPQAYSIIGRSVGLHSTAGPLFDCGAIQEVVRSTKLVNFVFSFNSSFERTDFTTSIATMRSDVAPSDVLIVNQVMTATDSMGSMVRQVTTTTGCVNMTASILGTTVDDANAKAGALESQFNQLYRCSGAVQMSSYLLLIMAVLAAVLLANN